MKRDKKLIILIYIFFLSSLFFIPINNFNNSDIFNNSIFKKNAIKKDYIIKSDSVNSISLQGTGSNLKGEEYPYNVSNEQGLINNDEINWSVPNTYSGKEFWVKIENLTANGSFTSPQNADQAVIFEGDYASGSIGDTNTTDGNYYQVNDDITPSQDALDFDFEFDISGISKTDVNSIFFYVVGQRSILGQDVQIRIYNFSSLSYVNIGTITNFFTWDTDFGTIYGNDCFDNSDPRIRLNFYSSDLDGNYVRLDHVYVIVNYSVSFVSVNPETINFRVRHESTNYPITSANFNSTTIQGNWLAPTTETFTFLSDYSANFDIETIFLLNKSRNADIYYYLAGNENFENTWKVNYSVGSIPSGYQNINFTVNLPNDWEYLNTTAPDGSDNTAQTNTVIIGNKLVVSVSSSAIDPFVAQLPLNWSIWANSSNYISTIQFFQYPDFVTPMLSPIIYNLTDNMTVKCPLSTPTNSPSSANLTIFNSTDDIVHQELNVDVIGSTITFTGWNTSKYNSNGQYKAQVTWFNGTQIGFKNSTFWCVYKTTVQMVVPSLNPFDWGFNRTLEVTVRFLNTFTNQGIPGASIAQYIFNSSISQNLFDKSNGNYNLTETNMELDLKPHDLFINFSKFGYHNITNFHIVVNIINDTELNLIVENFTLQLTNPTIINSYFPENITITANYTQLWVTLPNPLTNAILNISINENYYADMIPKIGQPGLYYLIINSSDLVFSFFDIGQNNITISAWKNGYFPHVKTFLWNIIETPTSLSANISTHADYGGIPFKVELYFNNTYHNYKYNITDANFTIKFGVSQTFYELHNDNITNYYNGTYIIAISFDIYNYNYNFQLNITAWRPGYDNKTVSIDTAIWVYNTSIVYWDYSSIIPLYANQTIDIGLNRSIFGNFTFPIGIQPDIDVKINQTYGVFWENITNEGNYTITLITDHDISNINASIQKVNITINKTNHKIIFLLSSFIIRENNTRAYITQSYEDFNFLKFEYGNWYDLNIYLNQTLDIFVNYTNNETGPNYKLQNETNDNIDINIDLYNRTDMSWMGYYNATAYISNQFNITIDPTKYNLLVGDYFLNISFKKFNYERAYIFVNLSVNPWRSYLIPIGQAGINTTINQWQDQTIIFRANYSKIIFNKTSPRFGIVEVVTDAIQWNAVINYTIKTLTNQTIKTGSNLSYNNITKLWELTEIVYLKSDLNNTIPPGLYKIWLNSSGNNIAPMNAIINLRVLEWLPSEIIFLSPPEISEDGMLLIFLQYKANNTPIQQALSLKLTLILEGGLPIPLDFSIKTGSDGSLQTSLPVFAGVKSILCWVEFMGTNDSYPKWSIKPSQSIPLSTSITSIWTSLVPIFVIAVVVFIGVITIYVINRKVRVKRQSKVMVEAEKTFDYFNDLISLRKIYIMHKKLQTTIFQQNYNMEDFNDFTNKALINMIKGFGKGKSGYSASLDLVRFQDLVIIIDDGDLTRTAFILSKLPTNKFLKGIVRFLQFFEINNYDILKKDGQFAKESKIERLLDYIFEISIILPYRVTMKGMNMKLNAFRSQLVMTAYECSPEGYFFIADLFQKTLKKSVIPEMMIFKEISYLIDRRAFILYSLKQLKEKGGKIKYISTKEVKFGKPEEKLKETPKGGEEPIDEEYITPVTARIMEDYEFPEPTLPTKLLTTELDTFEEPLIEEEIDEDGKTPFELIVEKEFEKPSIEEKVEIIEPEIKKVDIEKKVIPKKTITIKPIPIKPVIKPKPIEVIKIKPKPIKIIKPVEKPEPIIKKIKPKLIQEELKPSKFIQIGEIEDKKIDKTVIDVVNRTNKLITTMDEIEKYIGKSVKEIVANKEDIDAITLEVLKIFEDKNLIIENEIETAKTKLKSAEKIVEKLLFYLIDIEKELEKSDKEFSIISKDIRLIRKKFEKQSKSEVEIDLQKLDQVQQKLTEIDDKIVKSLEVREKFEASLNESAKIVEKLDDKIKDLEKNMESDKIEKQEIIDEKAKTYDLKLHCPSCNKIIEDRELNLLKKGFTPECPACGKVLKPSEFDL